MNEEDTNYINTQLIKELRYSPNRHLVISRLKNYSNLPNFKGYTFENIKNIALESFLILENIKIEKARLTADIGFFDETGKHSEYVLQDFFLLFYVATDSTDTFYDQSTVMDLDELLFYCNRHQNEKAKIKYQLPSLKPCTLPQENFNFIDRGRKFRNQYFPNYNGPVFDLFFEYEFNELYAIATNALAFLFRYKERAFEEIQMPDNPQYIFSLLIYPRFNNAISEVASTLYSFWERIIFFINEFFPININSKQAPSFKQYILFKAKEVKLHGTLNNTHFEWFQNRLNNEFQKLEDLRHPLIHYNKNRNPSGTRSVELMLSKHDDSFDGAALTKVWEGEIDFLKSELNNLSLALEHGICLMEEWATI